MLSIRAIRSFLTERSPRLFGSFIFLAISAFACTRTVSPGPAADGSASKDILDAVDADVLPDVVQPADLADSAPTATVDVGPVAATDAALDDAPDAEDTPSAAETADAKAEVTQPVPLCGVATGTTCASPKGCCPQACPAPYPCVCETGVACGWASIAKAKKARFYAASAFGAGKYWVFGGHTSTGPDEMAFATQLQDGEVYDPKTDQWQAIPAPPTQPILLPSAVWGGDRLYVYGATPEPNELTAAQKPLAYAAAWIPSLNKWQALPKLDSPMKCDYRPPMAWTGSELIVYGCKSYGGSGGARYSPVSNKWTPLAAPPLPEQSLTMQQGAWTGAALVTLPILNPPLVATDEQKTHLKLMAYYPATDSWNMFDDLPGHDGPFKLTMAPIKNGVFVLGKRLSVPEMRAFVHKLDQPDWQEISMPSWWKGTCTQSICDPQPTAAWTGKYVVLWNGYNDDTLHGGALFEPESKNWIALPEFGEPISRLHYSIATDGAEVFLSHGEISNYPYAIPVASGGRFFLPP